MNRLIKTEFEPLIGSLQTKKKSKTRWLHCWIPSNILSFKDLLIIFETQELQGVGEWSEKKSKKTDFSYPLIYFPGGCNNHVWVGHAKARDFRVSPGVAGDQTLTWSTFCWFSQVASREMQQKWSSWGKNSCWDRIPVSQVTAYPLHNSSSLVKLFRNK